MRGAQFGSHNQQFNVESHYHEAAAEVSERILVGYPPVADPSNLDRPALREAVRGPIVVLSGGAGTGKTQLAAAVFAAAVREGAELAIWASASSRTALVAAYAQAYAELRPGRVLLPGTDAEPSAARLVGRLRTTSRQWIVVLDDVTDAADLHELLPEGSAGRVIITSRLRGDAVAGRGHVVEVEHFTAGEAADYLRRRLRHRHRASERMLAESAELAGDLGHLPLALSVAASYLLDQGLTCAQYRDMLTDDSLVLGDLLGPVTSEDFGGSPVRAWQLSLDRADALAPAGVAAPLMRLIAVGDTNGIPEDLLLSAAACRLLGVDRPAARRALRNLHNLHLITHDPEGAPVAVRTHRLNQRAVLEAVGPAQVAATVRVMADGLVEVWPDAHQQPALAAALRANAAALMAEHWEVLWRDGAHPVLTRAGVSLGEIALVDAARDHFARMARTATDPADQLAARHHLAHYQGHAGDAAGAARNLEELLAERVALLGAEHPGTLASRNELAYWLVQSGHPREALTVAEALLADQLRLFGPEAVESLRTRGSAAYALGQAGRPREAVAAFERLLADEQRFLPPDDLELLITRNRLASWRGQAGDPAGAVAAFRSLLADERRVLGDDHPHTLIARHNLAHWLGEAGHVDEAVRDCEQLFADRLRVLGPDHQHTAATRNNLAHWYGMAGDPKRAARTLREVLPDRIRVLGGHHPLTLTTRNDLAWWTGVGGDWPRAAAELHQLYEDELPLLGADHLDALATANNLALCHAAAGERERAVKELESTVARMKRVLGDDHPHFGAARRNLDLLSHAAPPPGRLAALLRRVKGPEVTFIRGARGIQVGDGNTRAHTVSRPAPPA